MRGTRRKFHIVLSPPPLHHLPTAIFTFPRFKKKSGECSGLLPATHARLRPVINFKTRPGTKRGGTGLVEGRVRGEKIRGKEERSRARGGRGGGGNFLGGEKNSRPFRFEANFFWPKWMNGERGGGKVVFFFFKKLEICFDRIVVANYANYVTYFAIR